MQVIIYSPALPQTPTRHIEVNRRQQSAQQGYKQTTYVTHSRKVLSKSNFHRVERSATPKPKNRFTGIFKTKSINQNSINHISLFPAIHLRNRCRHRRTQIAYTTILKTVQQTFKHIYL